MSRFLKKLKQGFSKGDRDADETTGETQNDNSDLAPSTSFPEPDNADSAQDQIEESTKSKDLKPSSAGPTHEEALISKPEASVGEDEKVEYHDTDSAEDSELAGNELNDEQDAIADGAYDAADYENMKVSNDVKDLFNYITAYKPQIMPLDTELKPFLPEYIATVGDIDAFIKVTKPDNSEDTMGLTVLNESSIHQSDPTVLGLKLRSFAKGSIPKGTVVRMVPRPDKNPNEIDKWIGSISDLHRTKPATTVHYSKPMPDIDTLMQEWPAELEDLLSDAELLSADSDIPLETYVDLVCSVTDIPVYRSRIQSLHALFSLFAEFKNSQHFKHLAAQNSVSSHVAGNDPTGFNGQTLMGNGAPGGLNQNGTTDRLIL